LARKKQSYEQQATISLALAVIGGLCALVGTAAILQNFQWENFWTLYNPRSLRQAAILGPLLLACACGAAGFLFGFNSAGQRLNKKNGRSWAGFFLNAVVLALAMSAGIFFWITRYVPPGLQ
jgi:hypothetical protein